MVLQVNRPLDCILPVQSVRSKCTLDDGSWHYGVKHRTLTNIPLLEAVGVKNTGSVFFVEGVHCRVAGRWKFTSEHILDQASVNSSPIR